MSTLGARSSAAIRVVVDTNVIVSAVLKPFSVPHRVLDLLSSLGAIVYDERILSEYRSVLERPKFRAIERWRIDELFATLGARGVCLREVPAWRGPMTDSDDRIFVEAALAGEADALVTGNLRHYPAGLGFDVLPPATLLARLEGVGASLAPVTRTAPA